MPLPTKARRTRSSRAPFKRPRASPRAILDEVEQQVIASVLERNGGNISKTARELEIDRNTLKRRMATRV